MNDICLQTLPQVEVLSFQTFTTEYIAKRYGVLEPTIRDHKRRHADEIIDGLHFTTKTNKFGTDETLWTLRGIIKLGMFIRSNEAKNFRLWAEQELEQSILKELKSAKEARDRNLKLTDEISNLRAVQINQNKHYNQSINGYKSVIARQGGKIEELRAANTLLASCSKAGEILKEQNEAKFKDFNKQIINLKAAKLDECNYLKSIIWNHKIELSKQTRELEDLKSKFNRLATTKERAEADYKKEIQKLNAQHSQGVNAIISDFNQLIQKGVRDIIEKTKIEYCQYNSKLIFDTNEINQKQLTRG